MERQPHAREGNAGRMGKARPKLWIVGGPGVPAAELQARLSSLLDVMGQGACVCDSQGVILWSNTRFRGLDEQTRVKVAAACREACKDFAQRGPDPERMRRFEIPIPEGQRSLEVTISPVVM